MHIVTLTKRRGGDAADRASKWTTEKRLRVWTPPGFEATRPPPGGYPVLFMQDGQNMFEVRLTASVSISSVLARGRRQPTTAAISPGPALGRPGLESIPSPPPSSVL